MKIVIDKILDENIYFSTDYGMAKGYGKGLIDQSRRNIMLSWTLTDYIVMIIICKQYKRISDENNRWKKSTHFIIA